MHVDLNNPNRPLTKSADRRGFGDLENRPPRWQRLHKIGNGLLMDRRNAGKLNLESLWKTTSGSYIQFECLELLPFCQSRAANDLAISRNAFKKSVGTSVEDVGLVCRLRRELGCIKPHLLVFLVHAEKTEHFDYHEHDRGQST